MVVSRADAANAPWDASVMRSAATEVTATMRLGRPFLPVEKERRTKLTPSTRPATSTFSAHQEAFPPCLPRVA